MTERERDEGARDDEDTVGTRDEDATSGPGNATIDEPTKPALEPDEGERRADP